MKKNILCLVFGCLLILSTVKSAFAIPVVWELALDSTAGLLANNTYCFSIDTQSPATYTTEYNNTVSTTHFPSSFFYAEYVSKNGVEKGFDYLKYPDEDNYGVDWNLAYYTTSQLFHMHIETLETYQNVLYLNLYSENNDFFPDLEQVDRVAIADFDQGVNYGANVSAPHFTLTKCTGSAPVPEPATLLLLGPAFLGLAALKRKNNKFA